jgi:serine/threonine protein phosphatase PrpC
LFSSSSASTSTIGNKELIIFSQHAHFAKTKKPIYFSYENQHVCVTNRVAPAAKGSRAEDTTAIYEKDGYGLYGIFDGHGGPKVSDNLAKYFLPWLYQKFQSEKIPSKMDIQQWFVDYNEDLKKLKVKDDGSTALVLIKTPYAFHVAHCGDSRGVVYNMYTSSILHMTRDHDPSDDKQASEFLRADSSRRIEKVNGTYRVDGVLNLLRSFGDFGVNGISAEPEVFTRERNENHKFRSDWIFFGATDGYWNQYRLETKNKNNDRYSRQQAELLTQNVINKIEAYRTSSMSKSNNTSFLASMCQNINDRQAHDDVGTMITYLYDY